MAQFNCAAPGCHGLVQTTDPEHRHSGNHYFCDSDCEKRYEERFSTPIVEPLEPVSQDPDDEDAFFLSSEASDTDPTPEEEQARWDEIELDERQLTLSFLQELPESVHAESD